MNPTLFNFIDRHRRILVLTGAGVSTASGIPDYRDENGEWKHSQPIYFQEFRKLAAMRQRYWARSAVGWQRFSVAAPGRAHHALARLEVAGKLSGLITQNVDRLHQQAGSRRVIDLHGRLQQVICLDCGQLSSRADMQGELMARNPQLRDLAASLAPDGDALLENVDFSTIQVPVCSHCGGVLKPHVVFYGENVPKPRVQRCYAAVDAADAMLVAGSSLMVYSGFRFVRRAVERGLQVVAINRGLTRADDLLSLKIEQDCGDVLDSLAAALA